MQPSGTAAADRTDFRRRFAGGGDAHVGRRWGGGGGRSDGSGGGGEDRGIAAAILAASSHFWLRGQSAESGRFGIQLMEDCQRWHGRP